MVEKVKKTFRGEMERNGESKQSSLSISKNHPDVTKRFSVLTKYYDEAMFEERYKRLIYELKLGKDKRLSYDAIGEALDKASDNARVAGEMYVYAQQELDDFNDITFAIWWSEASHKATKELEKLKQSGEFSGQISEAKLKDYIIKTQKDDYKEMMELKSKLTKIALLLKALSRQWESKASLLQTQANLIEKRKTVVLGGKG